MIKIIVDKKELNRLNNNKHNLIRDFDKGYITKEIYEQQLKPVEEKINEKIKMLIESQKQKNKTLREDVNKMEEAQTKQTVQVEEPKKPGRKVRDDTYASVIAKVLMRKTITDINAAVAKVDEFKPGREKKKTITQIKTIIRLVKGGKGRWAKYTWNDEIFLLAEKSA